MCKGALEDAAAEAMWAGHIVRRVRGCVSRGGIEKTGESLPDLINESAAFGLLGAGEKSIGTRIDIDHDAASVLVDKIQIQQVMVNLIRNAVDAISTATCRLLPIRTSPDHPGVVREKEADNVSGGSREFDNRHFTHEWAKQTKGRGTE